MKAVEIIGKIWNKEMEKTKGESQRHGEAEDESVTLGHGVSQWLISILSGGYCHSGFPKLK